MENKKTNKKTKSLIICLVLLIVFAISIPIGFSLFSDKDNKSLNVAVGKVEVTIEEDTDWENNQDEFGIEKYTKQIKGVAAADSKSAYVRIKAIPVVQYYEAPADPGDTTPGKWITASVSQENILITFSGTNWVQSGEYWYYTQAIENGGKTSALDIRWQILQLDTDLATKDHLRTDVRVILEYAQAENDVWKDVFNIESLPF